MTRVSLHAALVGIGLGLVGTTQVAHAGGHFLHHKNTYSVQTVGVTQMAVPAVGITQMAMPVAGVTQMAMPMAGVSQMAVPMAGVSQLAMPTLGVSQLAMPTTSHVALMSPAFGQAQQAQSFNAFPQLGVGDVSAILDLIGRLRGILANRDNGGNGGSINPGNGGNGASGSCPEVRITISGGGATTVTGGAGAGVSNGPAQNTDLENAINQLAQARVQQMLAQATAKASPQAPGAALTTPAPQPADDKEAQRKAILDELEALKAKVNALK